MKADILGEIVTYRLGSPGAHFVWNSLAVLAAVKLAGADVKAAARALSGWQAQTGRGERILVAGKDGRIAIVDESYNANPASMRAALATLGLTPREEFGRRVAVLGDMLELGGLGPKLHQELAEAVDAADVDVVFACGEMMRGLYEALPSERRGGLRQDLGAADAAPHQRGPAGRHRHGQRVARQPDGASGRGAATPFRHGRRLGLTAVTG